MTRIVTYNLVAGSHVGAETKEQKRQLALEYIERLKQDETIEEIQEEPNRFIIYLAN